MQERHHRSLIADFHAVPSTLNMLDSITRVKESQKLNPHQRSSSFDRAVDQGPRRGKGCGALGFSPPLLANLVHKTILSEGLWFSLRKYSLHTTKLSRKHDVCKMHFQPYKGLKFQNFPRGASWMLTLSFLAPSLKTRWQQLLLVLSRCKKVGWNWADCNCEQIGIVLFACSPNGSVWNECCFRKSPGQKYPFQLLSYFRTEAFHWCFRAYFCNLNSHTPGSRKHVDLLVEKQSLLMAWNSANRNRKCFSVEH